MDVIGNVNDPSYVGVTYQDLLQGFAVCTLVS